MIERYTNPEMGQLWSLQHEFEEILEVELAACDAMAELGEIPQEAAANIRRKAKFDLARVHEIEKVTNHDIIAFLTNVAEYVGEDFRTNVEKDSDITRYLTNAEIEACFDYQWFLRNVDMIFARFGL